MAADVTDDDNSEVGSIGEELQRLTAAVAQWAATHRVDAGARDDAGVPEGASTRPASCDYCPICQLIAIGRGQHPEAVAKLIDTATLALRAVTDYLQAQEGQRHDPAPDRAGDGAEPATQARVQHIDID